MKVVRVQIWDVEDLDRLMDMGVDDLHAQHEDWPLICEMIGLESVPQSKRIIKEALGKRYNAQKPPAEAGD